MARIASFSLIQRVLSVSIQILSSRMSLRKSSIRVYWSSILIPGLPKVLNPSIFITKPQHLAILHECAFNTHHLLQKELVLLLILLDVLSTSKDLSHFLAYGVPPGLLHLLLVVQEAWLEG